MLLMVPAAGGRLLMLGTCFARITDLSVRFHSLHQPAELNRADKNGSILRLLTVWHLSLTNKVATKHDLLENDNNEAFLMTIV